jgi:hypothetical protein
VVADAVAREPVSTIEIAGNREKNREFCRIRPLGAILNADMQANSEAFRQIPCATKQRIISAKQGILAQKQGYFTGPKPKSSPDEVYCARRPINIPHRAAASPDSTSFVSGQVSDRDNPLFPGSVGIVPVAYRLPFKADIRQHDRNIRERSEADITKRSRDVCVPRNSGHSAPRRARPLWANTRHQLRVTGP